MLSFRVDEIGKAPALTEIPVPEPAPGEVQIRVGACGLNFADLLMVEGRYQETPRAPFTLGMEVAGTVLALGPGAVGPPPGSRVVGFAGYGGLAEVCCMPAERCLALPEGIELVQAAAFPIAYGTSHLALGHRARLQPGETLLVLGAAGGVGLTAVEIGRRMGARVIASARGTERMEIARAAGADIVIDSEAPDLKGRLLTIGFAGGDVPQIPANLLLVKNLTVIGLYWGGYMNFRPEVLRDSLKQLANWIAEGSLKPHVSHTLPLTDAAAGLDLLRRRAATGKVVITP